MNSVVLSEWKRREWADRLIFRVKFAFVVLLVFSVFLGYGLSYRESAEYVLANVTKCERISERNGSGRYLVFTAEETFEITDSWWFWRWDSSDTYGEISAGGRSSRISLPLTSSSPIRRTAQGEIKESAERREI